MITRISRRAIGCALLASTALTATTFVSTPAYALIGPNWPTSRPAPDSNGVDVITGKQSAPLRQVSIGQPGEGGLTYKKGYVDGVAEDTFQLAVGVGPHGTAVNVQGRVHEFTQDASGAFTSYDADGATLVKTGSDYTFTARDGTVIQFLAGYGDPGSITVFARGTTITKPNGEILNYFYAVQPSTCPPGQICGIQYQGAVRLQSITSNLGYQLKAYYATNTFNSTTRSDWLRLTKVVAINNAVDFCAAGGDTCPTFSQAWPKLDLSETVAGGTVTDTLADNLSNTETVASSGGSMSITSPASPTADVSYTFDANNRVSTLTRGSGTWTYTYADAGSQRTTTVAQPLGGNRVYVSDTSLNRVLSVTDELGHTTSMQYDTSGRLTRTTNPEGDYVQLTYDARGNVTETRHVAKTGSGQADIVTSAAFPSTCSNAVTCNRPTSMTDAKGNVTDYTYDPIHGGILTATQPAPTTGAVRPQVRYTYATKQAYFKNSGGSIVASGAPIYLLTATSSCQTLASCTGAADEVKASTDYGPQIAGTANNLLPVSTSKGSGDGLLTATTTNAYDVFGNLTSVDGPLSGTADTSAFRYDAVRRLTMQVSPDPDGAGSLKNRAQQITYDADGNVTRIEAGSTTSLTGSFTPISSGERVEYGYDSLGRKVKQSLVSGTIASPVVNAVTQYSYDAKGRLNCSAVRMNPAAFASLPSDACTLGTQGTFGPDRITKSVFDNADEVTQAQAAVGTTDAANQRTQTFTNNGLPQTLTDAENNKTTYVYDGFDRLSQTQYPNATKGSGTSSSSDYEQFGYDANSNVTSRRLRDGTSIGFTFDNLNRATFKDLPGAEPDVTYAFDNLGRLTSASQTGTTLSFTWDALGRNLTQVGPQGTVTSVWDLAGRRTQLSYPGTGLFVNTDYLVTGEAQKIRENGAGSGVGVLATYTYDDQGRRTNVTFGNGVVQSFSYDAASRLASFTNDLTGTTNDLSATFSYNPGSQLASTVRTGDSYAFNGFANENSNGTANGLNQLTSYGLNSLTHDGRGNVTAFGNKSFTYSSENLLLTGPSSSTLSYDPVMRLQQVTAAATTKFAYDGLDRIAEYDGSNNLLRRYVHGPDDDEPIVWYEGSSTTDRRFLSSDARGSIISVTDSSGTLLGANNYDEYGRPAAGNVGVWGYGGQFWIPELGEWYYKARVYDPELGTFLQMDPVGYKDSPNGYAYVLNDPVNLVDPFGLECEGSADNGKQEECKSDDSSTPPDPGPLSGGPLDGSSSCDCMSPTDPRASDSVNQWGGYYQGNTWVSVPDASNFLALYTNVSSGGFGATGNGAGSGKIIKPTGQTAFYFDGKQFARDPLYRKPWYSNYFDACFALCPPAIGLAGSIAATEGVGELAFGRFGFLNSNTWLRVGWGAGKDATADDFYESFRFASGGPKEPWWVHLDTPWRRP